MFNYKYPLLEVVQAIEHLQESKGTTNTQVCEFVQKMAKKPNDPMKVLKTVCALNKLVEEGVLVKKGRRYSLPRPSPKNDDDDMDQEEEKDDECDDDEDDNMKDSCDDLGDDDEEDCPEGGDDDNGDDDDDEDDEDDDDDDDDDDDNQGEANKDEDDNDDDENCNDKMEDSKKEEKKDDCPDGETEAGNRLNGKGIGNRNGNGFANQKGCNGELTCTGSADNAFGQIKHESTKKSKKHSKMITKAENVAFCARDFMDSQYRSFPDGSGRMEDVMEEDEKVTEKTKEIANIFQGRRRGSRSRQSQLSNPNYRSRSPVKGTAMDALQHRLAMEASDEIGPLKTFIKEAKDMELDVEPNRHEDFELFNRRSPIDPHPPNASGSLINGRDSYGDGQDKKEIKPEPIEASMNYQFGLRNQAETALGKLKCKEGKSGKNLSDVKKEKHKKEASYIKRIDDSKKSVCSVCDKKKRKKKN